MKISIFLFHRVSDEPDPLWPPMKQSKFESIIKQIKSKYHLVSLDNLHDIDHRMFSKKQLAAVCFDDGYLDNFSIAAPILRSYDCPATFFIVTKCIDTGLPTWTFDLDYRLANTRKKSIDLGEFLDSEFKQYHFKEKKDALRLARKIKPRLKKIPDDERNILLNLIRNQLNDVEIPRMMMNWEEIKALQKMGFGIGSHSHTHAPLANIELEDSLDGEMSTSFKRIEFMTGIKPRSIAYPVGSYDNRVKSAAKKAGYLYGFAVENRKADLNVDDSFSLPRIELYQENRLKTFLRMNGIIQKLKEFNS